MERSLALNDYEIEYGKILEWLKKNSAKKILVQAPDGLKKILRLISEKLEEEGYEAYLSGSHAWGGCDIAVNEARTMGIDTILHVGHHGFVGARTTEVRVLFVPVHYRGEFTEALVNALEDIKRNGFKKITLGVTVELHRRLHEIENLALKSGFHVETGSLENFTGLIMGCNYVSLRDAEAVLIVAGGRFHAIGAALWMGRPVWRVDPYLKSYEKVDVRPIISRRLRDISSAMDAHSFLVVVSTKTGQARPVLAQSIKKRILRENRKADIVVLDEISEDALLNLGQYDAYVNTACPRLTIDDPDIFPGPVINPGELKYILGKKLEGYDSRDLFRFDFSTGA